MENKHIPTPERYITEDIYRRYFSTHSPTSYDKGSCLYVQGDSAAFVSLVCSGLVETVRYSLNGKPIQLNYFTTNQFVGIEDIGSDTHVAWAFAKTPVVVVNICYSELKEALSDVELFRHLTVQTTSMLDMLNKRRCEAQLPLESQIVALAEKLPDRRIGMSHEEIAWWLNSNRESVTSAVSRLRSRGLIGSDRVRATYLK